MRVQKNFPVRKEHASSLIWNRPTRHFETPHPSFRNSPTRHFERSEKSPSRSDDERFLLINIPLRGRGTQSRHFEPKGLRSSVSFGEKSPSAKPVRNVVLYSNIPLRGEEISHAQIRDCVALCIRNDGAPVGLILQTIHHYRYHQTS
jgi:hypothetical protein